MTPLLHVIDLHKVYQRGRGQQVQALAGVGLQVQPAQTLGLVGESGCGKSTLARCVLGLERPSSGRVRFEGSDISTLARAARLRLRRRLQCVFQDPHGSLDPRMTVARIVAEPLVVHGLAPTRAQRREQVVRLLQQVELEPDCMDRFPHEFSGGQRQRIAIARALASGPRLVVADEPTSSLDVPVRVRILGLLRRLQEQHQLSYLFISHDLRVVRHMASEVAVMYLGRIVEQGPAATVCGTPLHPYTKTLMAAAPRLHTEAGEHVSPGTEAVLGGRPGAFETPRGCPFSPRCALHAERQNPHCTQNLPSLAPDEGEHRVACHEVESGGPAGGGDQSSGSQ